MRDIVEFVSSTLSIVGVPVVFQAYPTGVVPPSQYVTFMEYGTKPDLEAADEEITTERLIQVNVWSKGNYYQIVEDVRKILEQAGFQRTFEFDAPYTDGDSHFNKVLRFAFFDDYE
ncbi:hypothetical protein [Sporosarcina psychrophila]|uniref:DUF3168 domain-containing protein n=1 Tax=Sporosarcina psychrophila TaxID=1476 RepID=A0ABV2KAP9_SPOPS